MKFKNYTLETLKEAISTSVSIRQTLQKLNIEASGANYYTFHKAIKFFNLDTSHFTGQNLAGRKLPTRRRPLEDYLNNLYPITSYTLKKYVLAEKLLERKCSSCQLTEWLGELVPLELDHIDGNNMNNSLENLRLLCPNCHSFTPTYRGKNITKKPQRP